jgi:hypothetical protein
VEVGDKQADAEFLGQGMTIVIVGRIALWRLAPRRNVAEEAQGAGRPGAARRGAGPVAAGSGRLPRHRDAGDSHAHERGWQGLAKLCSGSRRWSPATFLLDTRWLHHYI